jgi:hypothetical protein
MTSAQLLNTFQQRLTHDMKQFIFARQSFRQNRG